MDFVNYISLITKKFFYIRNPTVTRVLQNLEKKGLIERQTNPQDNRSKVICLSDKAKTMEQLLYQLGNELEEKLTRNLINAPEILEETRKYLEKN